MPRQTILAHTPKALTAQRLTRVLERLHEHFPALPDPFPHYVRFKALFRDGRPPSLQGSTALATDGWMHLGGRLDDSRLTTDVAARMLREGKALCPRGSFTWAVRFSR